MFDLRLFFGRIGNIILFACNTFAWFTSQDEVTNRLTASADYGVSIVEDFTPPKQMVPGQEVDKDVAVVNTGSIDAFVRLHLINTLQVSRVAYTNLFDGGEEWVVAEYFGRDDATKSTTARKTTATVYYLDKTTNEVKTLAVTDADDVDSYLDTSNGEGLKDWFDAQDVKIGSTNEESTGSNTTLFQYLYATYDFSSAHNTDGITKAITTDSAIELSKSETRNGVELTANEVTTLQAGGDLVVKASKSIAPAGVRSGDDGENYYVQATDGSNRPVWTDGTSYYIEIGRQYYEVDQVENPDGVINYEFTGTSSSSVEPETVTGSLTPVATQISYKDFSGSAQFLPDETGLYVFRRTVYSDFDNTTTTEYSGYYYVKGEKPGTGKYYALKTKTDATDNARVEVDGYANEYTTTPFIDATFTTDTVTSDGTTYGDIVSKIVGLQLKTKTKMQDYTAFVANETAENGVYTSTNDPWSVTVSTPTDNVVTVTYTFGNNDTDLDKDKLDDIVFKVKLVDGWYTNWDYFAEPDKDDVSSTVAISDKENISGYFYLKKVLKSGETSPKLVDSVQLDAETTQFAFSDLIYDLTVKLDSIQVTYDQENRELADAAREAWHTIAKDVNVDIGEYNSDKTIKTITWDKYSED